MTPPPSILPVTALRFVSLDHGSDFVFAGTGAELTVYSLGCGVQVTRLQVLPSGVRVHGIVQCGEHDNRIIVHGGRFIALLTFTGKELKLLVRTELAEWIFDAFLDESDVMYVAVGHGAVVQLESEKLRQLAICCADECEMSWSATIHKCVGGFIVAHGTSFGAIVIRRFDRTFTHLSDDKLHGHAGAVTRLVFSNDCTMLASTSVDRSVRVWKTDSGNRYHSIRVHFGHLARVWDVSFLQSNDASVVSVGEDRYARIWGPNKDSLQIASHVVQDGRNVWAVDVLLNRYIIAGGDDGVIKLRSIKADSTESPKPLKFVLPHEYQNPKENWSSAPNESGSAIVFHDRYLYCGTDFGRVLRCEIPMINTPRWEVLITDKRGTAFSPNALAIVRNVLIAGQTDGSVFVLLMRSHGELTSPFHFYGSGSERRMVMGIWAFEDMNDGNMLHVFVTNPAGDTHYWVVTIVSTAENCVDVRYITKYKHESLKKMTLVTCVLLSQQHRVVLTGDRGGRIFVYPLFESENLRNEERHPLSYCRPHKDRVTDLVLIPNTDTNVMNVMSAGFDGRVVRLKYEVRESSLQVLSTKRSMERIDTIAKMYTPSEDYKRLVLLGFRSKYAVLWEVDEGNELVRCDCGNWRRPFDCVVDLTIESGAVVVKNAAFAFWRGGRLIVDQRTRFDERVQSIGPAFHGLRVNAICEVHTNERDVYLMSAGEDTVVRVMKCSRKSGEWATVQMLPKHISGVYDVATTSTSNNKLIAVSVGGCDEAVLWLADVAEGPWRCIGKVLGAGTDGLSNRNGRHRKEWNLDLDLANHRILCVEWMPGNFCNGEVNCVSAVIGRSDGSVAILRCCEGEDYWDAFVYGHTTENQGAVLCVALCERSGKLLMASGDSAGYVCVWELQLEAGSGEYTFRLLNRSLLHPGGVLSIAAGNVFVSGGDDGNVCIFDLKNEELKITRRTVSAGGVSGIAINGDCVVGVAMCQGVWSWRTGGGSGDKLNSSQLVMDMVGDICDPSDIVNVNVEGGVFISGYGLQRVEGLG